MGLNGNRLVLESDGTEVSDDETFVYFANEKATFIVLNDNEDWQELIDSGSKNPEQVRGQMENYNNLGE